ncbi:hypothetical protein [Embleya sp. NPDC059259]|uniref:hypothetical protein n=1 Tax=unclassified Embleya TaxID=2699296 RepID=UPI0036CACCAE
MEHLWPGAISLARDREQRAPKPGPFPVAQCPCAGCDLLAARDTLGEAMRCLPVGARRELERVVAPLDTRLLRRTAYDRHGESVCPWVVEAWWWQLRS